MQGVTRLGEEYTAVHKKCGKIQTQGRARLGATVAAANTITNIDTPTRGWLTVTNAEPAIVGTEIETDAQLRARQVVSTAKPSRTVLAGTKAGIAALPGVTRYEVYENDTSEPDENGIPGHSISAVVEGGDDGAIAREIRLRKTPGCGTYGGLMVPVAADAEGDKIDIAFWRPQYVDVGVTVQIHTLSGWSNVTVDELKQRLVDYINAAGIGASVPISWLWAVALGICQGTPAFTVVSLTAGPLEAEQSTGDIAVAYNAAARCSVDDIAVVEV